MSKAAPPTEKASVSPRIWWLCRLAVLVFGLLVYREALPADRVLFTTDDNVGALSLRKDTLPESFLGGWDDSVAVGQPNLVTLSLTNLLLWLLPVTVFVDWIHTIDLVLASLCLLGWFRLRGLRPEPALLAVLTAFWLGSNFFLTYAGHIGKFGVLVMASLYLYLLEQALQRKSMTWACLAGGALGAMFLEQADSALFFALFLGPYAIVRAGEVFHWKPAAWGKIVVPVAGLSALIGLHAVVTAYTMFSMEMPDTDQAVSEEAARQELWEYCTQWSLPPGEVIEWVAPGYLGWRSGYPEGPYWGRLGQSAEFEATGQGFRNFKLETFYKGAIPLLLVLFGAGLFFLRSGPVPVSRLEGRFWIVAVALSFLLGLGKFFPLYSLFFQLPGMSSIRNPVKFLQFTQLGLALLAGFGLEALLRLGRSEVQRAAFGRWLPWAGRVGMGLAALLGLMALLFVVSRSGAIERFAAEGYGDMARVIVANRLTAVVWAAVMMGIGLALGWRLINAGSARIASGIALAAVTMVAADQLIHARHYVSTVAKRSLIGEQPPVAFAKENLGHQRLYLLSQQGFYNNWLTILLPYNGVSTFNIAQMRMPEDYKAYFGAVGNDPLRLWAHGAIGLLMGPGQTWNQLQNDPRMRGRFELVYAFNVFPFGEGLTAEPATREQPGQHAILRPTGDWFRYRLYSQWQVVPENQVLATLQQTDPMAAVVVAESVEGLPAPTPGESAGDLTVLSYRPGRVHLRVNAETDAILRLADKYTPHWKARVGGKEAEVFRCDYLFQGVVIPAGLREVVVSYEPPLGGLWLQLTGLAGLVVAGGAAFRPGRRSPVPETA